MIRNKTLLQNRILPFRAFVAVLLLISCASVVDAQECPELPAVPKPELRNCGFLNLSCKNENERVMKAWEEQMRRFGTPMSISSEAEEQNTNLEYTVGGCRGSIVNLELNVKRLAGLKYELIAPSGTTVATEQLVPQADRTLGMPIRLSESGFYRVRLTTVSRAEQRQRCTKFEGSALRRRCVSEETYTAYPVDFVVAFRGNAEAPALRLGERGEGTVTQLEPLSRRIAVEAGQRLRARIVATGGRVACNVEASDGSPLPTTSAAGGCQVVFPETNRDATYVLALTAETNAPVGVTILAETGGAAQETERNLRLGQETEGLIETTASPGSSAPARAQVEWNVEVSDRGNYSLIVVPSGLARLQIEVTLYNRATEEVLIDRVRVSARRAFQVNFPVPARYILRITPLSYDAQSAQGGAKYTLLLER